MITAQVCSLLSSVFLSEESVILNEAVKPSGAVELSDDLSWVDINAMQSSLNRLNFFLNLQNYLTGLH